MSIILTKKIGDKEVALDLISIRGKTVIRNKSYDEAKAQGITKKSLEEAGYKIEKDMISSEPVEEQK